MGSRVDVFAAIRRDARVKELSIRAGAVLAAAGAVQGGDRRDADLRTWTRPGSSGTPRPGSWPAWSTSTTRRSCRTPRCGTTCGSAGPRSTSRPGAGWRRSSPRTTRPGWRPRSTSARCGSSSAGCAPSASCSCSGWPTPARRSTGSTRPRRRRPSWKGTSPRSRRSAASRRAHQVRQPQGRRLSGRARPRPCEGGERAVGAVPLPLRLRRVLLPTRDRGRPREGRRRGRGRLVPPQPPHPDARGDRPGRAQREDPGLGGRRRRPRHQRPGRAGRRSVRAGATPAGTRCRSRGSTRARCCTRGWTAPRWSPCGW
jgi:hypothetical protein